jgi:hypothetical protein
LREEHRLRVSENRVLRIFGPKRDDDGSWRKLRNDELYSLYSSPNIVRVIKPMRMRWAVPVARMGEGRCVCRIWVGRPAGKRPLGRPRRRWEDNISALTFTGKIKPRALETIAINNLQSVFVEIVFKKYLSFHERKPFLFQGARLKEDDMGGECSTHWRGENGIKFGREILMGRYLSEELV